MIHLFGHIDVPADRLTQVRQALDLHIQLTRAEPGNLTFEVNEDPDQTGRFHVDETYVDHAALKAHQARLAQTDWALITQGIERHYQMREITDKHASQT